MALSNKGVGVEECWGGGGGGGGVVFVVSVHSSRDLRCPSSLHFREHSPSVPASSSIKGLHVTVSDSARLTNGRKEGEREE